MKILLNIIISANIVGLLAVQIFETWRPGVISALISLPWLWLLSGVVIMIAGSYRSPTDPTLPTHLH